MTNFPEIALRTFLASVLKRNDDIRRGDPKLYDDRDTL